MGFTLGGFVSGLFGSKNKVHADTPQVNQNAYQYGGNQNGANEAANRYAQTGQDAQGRQGAQARYAGADQAYSQGQGARAGQDAIAQQQAARAMGQMPSIAGMQAQQDMQRAQAAQMAAASSARGPAGLALAQQQAANNTANAQGQISGQAQVNAANERLAAEQAAAGTYSNLRGGDLAGQQQLAQQSQFNAQLAQNQHGLNDQMQLGMTQAEMGVRNAQLAASQNQQAQQSANALGATSINAGVGGQNAAMNQQNAMGVLGLGSSTASGLMGGAAPKAEGGPTQLGKPYIVGERGPELIVPKTDGVVIPNHKLGAFLAGMGGKASARADGGPVEGYAPSTWGVGGPATGQQDIAKADADIAVAQFAHAAPPAYVNPYQRDLDRVAATRRAGLDVNEQDVHDERVARNMLRYQAQRAGQTSPVEASDKDEKASVVAGNAVPTNPNDKKPGKLGSLVAGMGNSLSRQAAGVDVGYHGGQGFVPPQLLAVQGRAFGGPVQGGVAPDQIDLAVQKFYGAYGAKAPSHQPGMAFLEEGGDAPKGKPAVVGEAGPEIVVERPKEPTWQASNLARALASRQSQEAPAAAALYEPDGKQLHQSAEGHAYLAEPPQERQRASLASIVAGLHLSQPAPAAGAQRPPPPPPKAAPRKMTNDELMAEADRQIARTNAAKEASLAAGPALRVPVTLGEASDGSPIASVDPPYAPSPHALPSPQEETPYAPSPHALLPPGATQWSGTNYHVIPKELPYTMSRKPPAMASRRKR